MDIYKRRSEHCIIINNNNNNKKHAVQLSRCFVMQLKHTKLFFQLIGEMSNRDEFDIRETKRKPGYYCFFYLFTSS